MNCPRCDEPTQAHTLDDHGGRPLTVDMCRSCQSIWFDQYESIRLTPASTLALFRLIGENAAQPQSTDADGATCPRCRATLRLTHDMQRTTRFTYLKCPAGHGRLTTFFEFLKEKDFVRPLSSQQVAELARNVETINCSNCGAPVDLARGSVCAHCRSPLTMLDMKQAEALVEQLRRADRTGQPVDPALPMALERARREAESAFAEINRDTVWMRDASSSGLVAAGLNALARWLKG